MLLLAILASWSLGAPADGKPHTLVERARLMDVLCALPRRRAARGDVEHQRGLARAEQMLVERLREMGHDPRLEALSWNLRGEAERAAEVGVPARGAAEVDPELAARTWHNIIVELPGTRAPGEILIVGAHFDAVPGSPGADDNGTGTAALLELARVLKGHPMERTVRLVLFNLEEIGLVGAREHVRGVRERGETVVGMISLEMLGYFTDEPGSQRSPIPPLEGVFEPPTVGDFIGIGTIRKYQEFSRLLEREMRRAAPELKIVAADFMPVPPPDFLRSDHAPFMMAGVPAVIVTDTSNFRNPNYHTPGDSVETLDPERFALAVRAVAGAVHAIAGPDREDPPTSGPR